MGAAAIALVGLTIVLIRSRGDHVDTAAPCGTKVLHGEVLQIRVKGDPVPCEEVNKIISGPCELVAPDRVDRIARELSGQPSTRSTQERSSQAWSCFSYQPPGPIMAWFPAKEMFREHFSTTIYAERLPCARSVVTAGSWRDAGGTGFPNQRQVLADDLVRCGQLEGKSYRQVLKLLGPGTRSASHGNVYLDYLLGDERDSFFQVDSEGLSITFDPQGRVKDVGFFQS